MAYRIIIVLFVATIISVNTAEYSRQPMTKSERLELREEARSMFYHAYRAYMENAYPADELMPLSCKGRYRGVTPSRGDMDDVLGNFSLTLVDSLDTLVILGDFEEFNSALKLVIKDVTFDHDIVVSVFETNIRMLGGLLSAHILTTAVQKNMSILNWYRGELLDMAQDLGRRLLPAFNTSTGIPHGRINLRYGIKGLSNSRETCTACAGTMILEMAALSRLTGDYIYEQKAHKAMDELWKIRHRSSDLMGTVINIHSGDWVRKDAGIGAGIDSYYEYCLKAYILLGDERYLIRFNRHYNAIMKYISRGPIMLDVHMHRPHLQSRNFMDALLAFWPGLQVLLGDVKPAVETHEMLYQVMQKHTLIPDAFTSDFQVHWGHHPIRPEFLESTYFLHRATGDDHYLRVGAAALKALQKYTRVPCGYAAVNDVRTRVHEDRMDSFVLSETFKYLYMLFGYDHDIPIKIDDYVFTTEAHLLPLTLASSMQSQKVFRDYDWIVSDKFSRSCPNTASFLPESVRTPLKNILGGVSRNRLVPKSFVPGDPRQVVALADMGISVVTLNDGRVQLLYTTSSAKSAKFAEEGLSFMKEMTKWTESDLDEGVAPVGLLINNKLLHAGPGHFGKELTNGETVTAGLAYAYPPDACKKIENSIDVVNNFGIAIRGKCTFAQKVRNLKSAGAEGAIIIDNVPKSSSKDIPFFAMSGDGIDDIDIPSVFLFSAEAEILKQGFEDDPEIEVTIGELTPIEKDIERKSCLKSGNCASLTISDSVYHPNMIIKDNKVDVEESFLQLKDLLGKIIAQFDSRFPNEHNIFKANKVPTLSSKDTGKTDDIVLLNNKIFQHISDGKNDGLFESNLISTKLQDELIIKKNVDSVISQSSNNNNNDDDL